MTDNVVRLPRQEKSGPSAGKTPGGCRGFFAVDRRAWAKACVTGLNSAVSYLVLARGSLRDMRTTSWSDNAIRKYTGLGRIRTDRAMAELTAGGLVRQDAGGARPRYYLMPAHEVPGCEGHMPALSAPEQQALGELVLGYSTWFSRKASRDWGGAIPYDAAQRLTAKRLARELADGRFEPIPYDAAKAAEPDWIWLPNTIVDGAADETPPLQLLRSTQNLAALRLFVDLYHEHNLADDGGIHWRRVRQSYTRCQIGQQGPFIVWGFQEGIIETWTKVPFVASHLTGKYAEVEAADGSKSRRDTGLDTFWEAERLLVGLGLLEFVGQIIEADNDDSEIVHPYAIENGEASERDIATAAQQAAETLLIPGQVERARASAMRLLPVRANTLPNVQMVGIARLRYRPQTKATAAWTAKRAGWAGWADFYRELAPNSKTTTSKGYQRNING